MGDAPMFNPCLLRVKDKEWFDGLARVTDA
jgi:hypothetical protein